MECEGRAHGISGRDGILVATYEGATFVDGDRRTPVLRKGPAKADGRKMSAKDRRTHPVGRPTSTVTARTNWS